MKVVEVVMKKKGLIKFIVIVILVLVAIFAVYKIFQTGTKESHTFRDEYECLNGVINPNNNKVYPNVSLPSDNKVVYSNYDEILDLLDNGTGVIYFGYPECPWCRNAVPVLVDAVMDSGVDKIYYMNMKNERDQKDFDVETLQVKTIKEADPKYYELLKKLDKYLDDYTVTKDEIEYSLGEKRIYVPMVVFVKNGEVIGVHSDTVSSQTDPYVKLDNKQTEELKSIYSEYLSQLVSCNVETKGC